ncbi:hypothetical protein [Actinocatenispora rupis]|uniref:DUF2637 domain-containing protein n=1 Tax=Actinocatenispora rupis TaxID=519421 RepID=A0A8J3J7H0_9ACTN|nr:hypothetical protein [Actinocatenispora rupis]GID16410.1 hypothetical protein Aru02nite_72990 [Actinocatenispora rupis]
MTTPRIKVTERFEDGARLLIMAAIGAMAGAASFTHMHDWTMHELPAGTKDWFGWANAVASELMPTYALLEIRRKRRKGGSVGLPVALLIGSGVLSICAQVSQAGDSLVSKGLAALPAVAFTVLTKMAFSGMGTTDSGTPEPVAAQQNAPEAEIDSTPAPVVPVVPEPAPAPAPSVPLPADPAPAAPVTPVVSRPVIPTAAPVVPSRSNGAPVVIG